MGNESLAPPDDQREVTARDERRVAPRRAARERRKTPSGRRASDGQKMNCPFCQDAASAVVSSYGLLNGDKIRRRRECVGCSGRFPTSEQIDWQLLARELEARGEALSRALTEGILQATWDNAFSLVHRAWGEAREGRYPAANQSFSALNDLLRRLQRATT